MSKEPLSCKRPIHRRYMTKQPLETAGECQVRALGFRDLEIERENYKRMISHQSEASREYTKGKMTVQDQL